MDRTLSLIAIGLNFGISLDEAIALATSDGIPEDAAEAARFIARAADDDAWPGGVVG